MSRAKHPSPWRRAARRFIREPIALAALIYLVVLIIMAIAAPLVATHEPNFQDLERQYSGPSTDHWLGTDNLGRDTFSRLVYGARTSLKVSFLVAFIGLVIAMPIGLFSGYRSGKWDSVVMRITDALLSIPPLVLALAIAGILGPGTTQRHHRADHRRHPGARAPGPRRRRWRSARRVSSRPPRRSARSPR